MANSKIIAIIDHENRALRSDVDRSIHSAVNTAAIPIMDRIEQLEQRVRRLEQEGVNTRK